MKYSGEAKWHSDNHYAHLMLPDLIDMLACPHCGGELRENSGALVCSRGHTSNIARQGYVSLLGRDAGTHTADSMEMVAARERFLSAGNFQPIADGVVEALAGLEVEGPVVDIGAGPGWYLARVLDAMPDRSGLALDNSKFAARKAARCHARAGAVVADIWDELPVMTGSAAAAINIFSPRNGIEIHRILANGGRLVVVTPGPDHLHELIEPFGMISVDSSKQQRLEKSLGEAFEMDELPDATVLDWRMELNREAVGDLIAMGPSAGRLDQEALEAALAGLAGTTTVTASVRVNSIPADAPEFEFGEPEGLEEDESGPDEG